MKINFKRLSTYFLIAAGSFTIAACGNDKKVKQADAVKQDQNKPKNVPGQPGVVVDQSTNIKRLAQDLQDHQKSLVNKNAPVIIQPQCGAEDFPCEINYDGDNDPGNNANAENLKKLSDYAKRKATIYVDYFESGGAVAVAYMPYRAVSVDPATGKRDTNDSESVIYFYKKAVGNSFADKGKENLATASLQGLFANAFGHQLLAVSPSSANILPSFPKDAGTLKKATNAKLAELKKKMETNAKDQKDQNALKAQEAKQKQMQALSDLFFAQLDGVDRTVAMTSDNRPIVLSLPGVHALTPVTNLDSLKALNDKSTFVFVFDADKNASKLGALKDQILPQAKVVSYDTVELAPLLILQKDQLLAGGKLSDFKTKSQSWDGEALEPVDIPTDFKAAAGQTPEANLPIAWGIAATTSADGKSMKVTVTKAMAKTDKVERIPLVMQAEAMERVLGVTAQAKDARANRVVRNPYLRIVPAPQAAKK